jgi:hypothetical protein
MPASAIRHPNIIRTPSTGSRRACQGPRGPLIFSVGTLLRGGTYRLGTRQRLGTKWGTSMGILISILITFLVIVLVLYLINMLPIDGRAKQIVRVIVIIIGVLSLLKYLAVY